MVGMRKKDWIVFGIVIASLVLPMLIGLADFDREGNFCKEYSDMRFYSEDGQMYAKDFVDDDFYMVNVLDKNEKYLADDSYINKAGYIEFDVENLKEVRKHRLYENEEGDLYFAVDYVTWNVLGFMKVDQIISDDNNGYIVE